MPRQPGSPTPSGRPTLYAAYLSERPRLVALAARMLGSTHEGEDMVQQAWLRGCRTDTRPDNAEAWWTTVVSRLCLDALRGRARHPHLRLGDTVRPEAASLESQLGPAQQTELAAQVGGALLVVMDRLEPVERVAFVLHDLFGMPFAEVALVLEYTPGTAKKVASRARTKVRGAHPPDAADWELAAAFLAAARGGDLTALMRLLAPGVVRRADSAALSERAPAVVSGAEEVADETKTFVKRLEAAEVATVEGAPGLVVAPAGRLLLAVRLITVYGMVEEIVVIADAGRLDRVSIAVPVDRTTAPAGGADA